MFQHTAASTVAGGPGKTAELPLRSAAERFEAYQFHKKQLIPLGRERREDHLSQLSRALKIVAPKDRMLTWDEAREMQREGIEFGAHTFSHPLLGKIAPSEAIWEIEKSRDDLKESLGVVRPSFCFPAGSWTQNLLEQIPALGLRSVFVPNRKIRVNTLKTVTPYRLSRIGMPNSPRVILEAELDGPFHSLRNFSRQA
jgi:peptidoglycan/xylan/chitin deacetylase (PgdA/CDA1 family)